MNIGRPRIDPKNRKAEYIQVRVTPEERKLILQKVGKNGCISNWLRTLILQSLRSPG